MTSTNKTQAIALCLILSLISLAIAITNASTEDNYKNDTNRLPGVYESTHAEGNYKADIILNPDVTGAYINESNYKIDLTINPNGIGGILTENNYQLDLIPQKSFPEQKGILLSSVITSKTIVGQAYNMTIKVTIINQEFTHETFSITIYANTTAIFTTSVTLPSKGSTTITFRWNTIGFSKNTYTISAQATPIPGEIYTVDNTHINGNVKIIIPCDANGDGKVNLHDLFDLGKAYGSVPPMSNWNPNCDFNENNNVDNPDLSDLSQNYGTIDP